MTNSKDVKRKSRRTKILVIVLSSSVAVVLMIFFLFGLAKILVRWYDSGTYYDYDPDKMVVYLEKRYNIDFPHNMKEVKAAKSGQSWDRWSDFILKFTATQSEVNKFVETAVGNVLYSYHSRRDSRFNPHESAPEWWTKPIKKGQRGRLYVEDTYVKDWRSTIYVYIDTSDKEDNVVYLQGIYRSELDH